MKTSVNSFKNNTRTKAERKMLLKLQYVKIGFIIILILNMFLMSNDGLIRIINFGMILVHISGFIGGHGYFDQYIPLLPAGIIRVAQLVIIGVGKINSIEEWLLLFAVDILYISYLLSLKSKYRFKQN